MISNAVRLLPTVPALASMMLAAGAAHAQAAGPHQGARATSWEESGEASWYGGRHNGRRTSSGAIFRDTDMTAAHATLPLGTKVRVTVQDTGESVVVTVTDRQPPKRVRVIDLSRGAASRVGILSRGTAMVTLSPARADDVEEVAEAPDTDADQPRMTRVLATRPIGGAPRRRGQPHTLRAARVAVADHPCCRTPSAVPARHSVRRQAAQRRL